LKSEDERGGPRGTLDLEELDLVDIDAVRFLNARESAGVSILHCSPYVREWMQERSRLKDDPGPFQRALCYTGNREPSDLNDSSTLKLERSEENNHEEALCGCNARRCADGHRSAAREDW
jgi:hypothetical protein